MLAVIIVITKKTFVMTQINFRCSREIWRYPRIWKNFGTRSEFVANLYAQLPIGSENEAFQVAFPTRLKSAFGRLAALVNHFGTKVGTLIPLVLMLEVESAPSLARRPHCEMQQISTSSFQLQMDRSPSLLGVRSSDWYHNEAHDLYFHASKLVFVFKTFPVAQFKQNELTLPSLWIRFRINFTVWDVNNCIG